MSGIELCWPSALIYGQPVASAGSETVANLLTRDPKEAWLPGVGSASVTYDFGSPQPWDTAFLGFTTVAPSSQWSLSAGNTAAADTTSVFVNAPIVEPNVPLGLAGALPRIVHLYAKAASIIVSRYVKITVSQPAGAAALRAGVLMINAGFRTLWPQELGSGRYPIDTGVRERLVGGGFATSDGVVKSGYQWTFGDLSSAETDALHLITLARGERWPLLVVEDPTISAGLQERMHYGVFDRLEAWERRDVGKTRWAFRMEEWA